MGIGYQKVKVEGIKVAVDKSTKIDFNLRYSDEYILTEKQEQFYLQKFAEDQRIQLNKLKEKNKLEYQRQLMKMLYMPPGDPENETAAIFQNILQLTKQIDELASEYKSSDNDEKKGNVEKNMIKKLGQRFALQENKMQLEIKKLSEGIGNLQKELQKFRADKETIIQRQFESFVD